MDGDLTPAEISPISLIFQDLLASHEVAPNYAIPEVLLHVIRVMPCRSRRGNS